MKKILLGLLLVSGISLQVAHLQGAGPLCWLCGCKTVADYSNKELAGQLGSNLVETAKEYGNSGLELAKAYGSEAYDVAEHAMFVAKEYLYSHPMVGLSAANVIAFFVMYRMLKGNQKVIEVPKVVEKVVIKEVDTDKQITTALSTNRVSKKRR